MKIAQVSPLYESVPPKLYGGTERIVSYLTEELVAMGHQVTLFAAGDSISSAKLMPMAKQGLRMDSTVIDPMALHYLMLERVMELCEDFDIIHFHVDYLHFAFSKRKRFPHLTTLHGRLDIPEVVKIHEFYRDMPLVSISNAQQKPTPASNWVSTIYHGLPTHLYHLNETPEPYLAFIGRISPEKRLDRAIEIAELSGMPLKVAAKIDSVDKDYYDAAIRPLITKSSQVEFLGEINDQQKQSFLGNATALLFPIDWPEPFGLVMIEAMACGTPVIAFAHGAVPEVIDHGQTGMIVRSVPEAVQAVQEIGALDRKACRAVFDRRFTARRMATDYLKAYQLQVAACHYQQRGKTFAVAAAL